MSSQVQDGADRALRRAAEAGESWEQQENSEAVQVLQGSVVCSLRLRPIVQ